VDRITQIIISYMDKSSTYKIKDLKAGSKLAIISNLALNDLNQFYIPFMDKGYIVSGLQGNSIKNTVDDASIEHLQYIYTRDNSYDIITDRRDIILKSGTWAGEKYAEESSRKKDMVKKYDFDYDATKDDLINRLLKAYNGNVEYLLIVGFNAAKSGVWVRCIDLKNKDLIWMQDNIYGKDIADISYRIIEEMSGSAASKSPLKDKTR